MGAVCGVVCVLCACWCVRVGVCVLCVLVCALVCACWCVRVGVCVLVCACGVCVLCVACWCVRVVCACWCVRVGVCVLVCACGCVRVVCACCVCVCVGVCVCELVCACGVCLFVWHAENLRVCIQHGPVCAFQTFPCVPATCPHVLKHVGMLPVHTGTF